MASKKSEKAESPETLDFDRIVVGSGVSSLGALREALQRNPTERILLLESGERLGGHLPSGLHLARLPEVQNSAVKMVGPLLSPIKIRWEREWLDPTSVDWNSKEWAQVIPQWSLYFSPEAYIQYTLSETDDLPLLIEEGRLTIRYRSPVRSLIKDEETSLWTLETPLHSYRAPQVVWGAGLLAFQNAYGKLEASRCLEVNPDYQIKAADWRAGLAMDFDFEEEPLFAEGFPREHLMGIPIRHEGKLHLMITVYQQNPARLRTLLWLENDLLTESKQLGAYQKSIRRTLKNLCAEDCFKIKSERFYVQPKVGGHRLGLNSILSDMGALGLDFVGDESRKYYVGLGAKPQPLFEEALVLPLQNEESLEGNP